MIVQYSAEVNNQIFFVANKWILTKIIHKSVIQCNSVNNLDKGGKYTEIQTNGFLSTYTPPCPLMNQSIVLVSVQPGLADSTITARSHSFTPYIKPHSLSVIHLAASISFYFSLSNTSQTSLSLCSHYICLTLYLFSFSYHHNWTVVTVFFPDFVKFC